jgi:hypothetical protein
MRTTFAMTARERRTTPHLAISFDGDAGGMPGFRPTAFPIRIGSARLSTPLNVI